MKKYILILVTLAIGAVSCDFLDRQPYDSLTPGDYFKTETDLQLFSNNFYASGYIFNSTPYDGQNDLFFQGTTIPDELRGGTNRQVPASGGGWNWGILRKINTLLGYIDQCEDEQVKLKYTALARFFRAAFYFQKLQRFGDVPWIDRELGSADEELQNPRDNREVIITHMIEDVDFAIENLPTAVSTYRVNKWAALALKAQFCLYEGTFRKYHAGDVFLQTLPADAKAPAYYLGLAANAAKEIMNGNMYKLFTTGNPNSDYGTLFRQPNASKDEYILAVDYNTSLQLVHDRTFNFSQNGSYMLSKKAVDMYLKADGTRFTSEALWQTKGFIDQVSGRDPRLAQTIVTPGYKRVSTGAAKDVSYPWLTRAYSGYYPHKFVMDFGTASANAAVDPTDKSYNDLPIYRYGEVLLNYAEAHAELGDLTQAMLDESINLLRDRVGMPHLSLAAANADPDWYLSHPDYGYSNVSGANKGIILEIRRERTVELMAEGDFRWNDLMRWKEGSCIAQAMEGFYVAAEGDVDLSGDGVADYYLYSENDPGGNPIKHQVKLTEGTKGNIVPFTITHVFDETRDYLFPIPSNERSLNRNLTQNPNWDDGLDF